MTNVLLAEDDPARDELVKRLRGFARRLRSNWKASVARVPVENCELAWEFVCPKQWDSFTETDETADKVLLKPLAEDYDHATAEADPGAWYATDSALRDEERIPLKTDIVAYFAKEVLPYASDAWMDRGKDKVGYEISFTRYFYEYQPPRALRDILADLEALDKEADQLQAELRA